MTRVHDMGGRFGDGPVAPEGEDAPVFEKDWHARALAVTLASGALGKWNIDVSRHARERLSPKDYTRFSYYEKWISGLADLLVETGVLTLEDLKGEGEDTPHPLAHKAMTAEAVPGVLAKGGPADRPSNVAPAFVVGQAVRTARPAANRLVDGGHTRLPAYAQGAVGRVLLMHGAHVLPDSNAHGLGEAPEPLYAVVFPATELWADAESPDDEVVLDLWQSYLEPV
ncbi:Low-molecular weight cobalt-containing nitrile hydratase subunit beta [Falsiruegeria litorea R37]|uniref:Nitrile hydratase subunit beta n=1 Tax=Falsiruegeria litorea R37 TaxID=1200284 RepID=A0A1Y5TAP6_9RHOB|nr:nitrile hydratase subunit beta [Falsiruegeria litorea]SLN57647.1 Low-molecular weight cobalt-containing nitrile hydratase subunit beta [Falsiruegeria litorea R37]